MNENISCDLEKAQLALLAAFLEICLGFPQLCTASLQRCSPGSNNVAISNSLIIDGCNSTRNTVNITKQLPLL